MTLNKKRNYLKGFLLLSLAFVLGLPAFAQTTKTKKGKPKLSKEQKDSLKTINLDAVNITATRLLFVSKKDTMVYNLNALTLQEGAMLGDALKRLPGIVLKDGKLFYKGEAVDRLLINGIDFAKEDPTKALNVLPAYVVGKVKAFSQIKESSRLSGYDDGSRDIVLDVRLKKKYQGTWTGEAEVGGGYKDLYLAKGFANTFTDRYRISLFANANNVNQQLWYKGSGKATNGYKGRRGVWEFLAPGGTFFWKTKAEQGKKGYFIIEGDTDFNREEGQQNSVNEKEQYLDKQSIFESSRKNWHELEYRWAGHLNFEWCPTDDLLIVYKPTLEIQKTNNNAQGASATWHKNPFQAKINMLDSLLVNPNKWKHQFNPAFLNRGNELSFSPNNMIYHYLFVRQKLSPKSNLSLNHILHATNNNNNDTYSLEKFDYFNDNQKNKLLNRYYDNDDNFLYSQTVISLSQQIKDFHLEGSYTYKTDNNKRNNLGYRLDKLGALYNNYNEALSLFGTLPDNFEDVKNSLLEEETSVSRSRKKQTHSIGLNLGYKKSIYYVNFRSQLNYFIDNLDYQKGNIEPISLQKKTWYPHINIYMGFNDSKKGRLNVKFVYNTRLVDLERRITLPNLSNPQHISLGNPDLKDEDYIYTRVSYHKTFNAKIKEKPFQPSVGGSLFFSLRNNSMSQKIAYDKATGVATTMPVNTGQTYHLYSEVNIETPLELKQRLLLGTNFSYTGQKNQSYAVAGTLTEAKLNNIYKNEYNFSIGPMLRLSKFNFYINYGMGIEQYNSTATSIDGRKLYKHIINSNLTWNLPLGINLSAGCRYTGYRGYESKVFQPDITMLNVSLDKAFLKDKALTVFVRANDLLNQNNGFSSYFVNSTIYRDKVNTLGRHVMVGLKYRFSTKKQ